MEAAFELPYLEDIYDMETEELEQVLARIDADMQRGEGNCALPTGIETFEKYERKAAKLKDSLELELEERSQVDNVLNFFTDSSKNYLDDDAFYRLDNSNATGTNASNDNNNSSTQQSSQLMRPPQEQLTTTSSAYQQQNNQQVQASAKHVSQKEAMFNPQQSSYLNNQTVGAGNNSSLLNEIDPHRLMDDQQSEYSTSQKSHQQRSHAALPDGAGAGETNEASSQMMRKPMTKKELQAFMKAKLAKTKVTDQATTMAAATGPGTKNFTTGGRRAEPTQRKDLVGPNRKPPAGKKPVNATPSTYKGKGNELSDEDSEDDIAAANEKMKKAALKFAANSTNMAVGPAASKKKKVAARSSSKGFEDHKTTVRNTSKSIYKPCFNMPAKEPKQQKMMSDKEKSKPTARDAAKAYSEAQRKKQRNSSAARTNRTPSQASMAPQQDDAASATGTKMFSKPKLSSSKGPRNEQVRTSTQSTRLSEVAATTPLQQSGKPPKAQQQSQKSTKTKDEQDEMMSEETKDDKAVVDQKETTNQEDQPPRLDDPQHQDNNTQQVTTKKKHEEEVTGRNENETEDNQDNLSEEIESRYSDEQNHQQIGATAEEQRQEELSGETGTTDLNSDVVNKVVVSSEQQHQQKPIESTSDMIMRRAEQNGEFDQFQEAVPGEAPLDKEDSSGTLAAGQADQDAEATTRVGDGKVTEEERLDGEAFSLGPDGFQQATSGEESITDQKTKQPKVVTVVDLEGTVGSETEFYTNDAGDTEEMKQLKEMTKANDGSQVGDNPWDAREYSEGRARLEEIKKEVAEDQEDAEIDQSKDLPLGGADKIDIEAENQQLIDRQLDQALMDAGGAKVELDTRLQKATDDAKAKGKKTVRTFDMLRKAISGDPEQRKKEQDEKDRKKAETEAAEKVKADKEKLKSAAKAQTGSTLQTPVKPQAPDAKESNTETKSSVASTAAKKTDQSAAAKQAAKKRAIAKNIPTQFNKMARNVRLDEDVADYSHIYRNFYDIFVGSYTDQKAFDLNFAVRETRNIYASFVNLMENNVVLSQKHKFEKHPLEMGYYYKQQVPNHLSMVGEKLDELEDLMNKRDVSGNIRQQQKQLMVAALTQQQLQEKYKQLKNKNQDEINKDAVALAEAAAPADDDEDMEMPSSSSSQVATQAVAAEKAPPQKNSTLYFRVVKTKSEVYDIITRSFSRKPCWNELPHGLDLRNSWNLMWLWSKLQKDMSRMLVWQKANHFIGAKNVSRKDFLKRNIERAQKFSGRAHAVFNVMPLTFILPKEYVAFLEMFSDLEDKEGKMNYWIMKPSASSRGRGISVVNDISQVSYGEPMVMQRYIKNPLLLNGYKFDLRIYILVTSVNPLEVFIYKEGFGRFSTQPYTLDPTDKANKYIHLTNVSINKYNLKNYDCNQQDRIYGGSKVSLATLKKTFVEDLNIDWDNVCWTQIKQVCLKSLVAAQNDIAFNPNCFDLYGFDVIFDEDMKGWLLEINASPALSCDTLLDDLIKQRLIDDTIDLIDPVDFDRKRLFEVLERRTQEEFGAAKTQSNQHLKRSMNKDLNYVLHGKVPRAYGEMPKAMGNYERLAPSELCDNYLKLIGGQKMFGSAMKVSEKMTPEQRAKVRGPGSMPPLTEKSQLPGGGVQATPKGPRVAASMGGTTSAVTQRKQQQAMQINMNQISGASNHRPLLKP